MRRGAFPEGRALRYAIRSRGGVIGYSDLEHDDLSMGVVFGAFRPTPAYAAVRHVFRLFAEDRLDEYYAARDRLGLELVDARGRVVPTETIHIEDFTDESGAAALRAEAILVDAYGWPPGR